MSTHQYLHFDQLMSELQAENRRRQRCAQSFTWKTLVLAGCDEVTFDSFCNAEPPTPLVPPPPPDVTNVEVGSRVTLLSSHGSEGPGNFKCHFMLVLGIKGDQVQGYVISETDRVRSNRCEVVSKAQIIELHPPLSPGEQEIWDLYVEEIPC